MKGAVAFVNLIYREYDFANDMHILTFNETSEFSQSPSGAVLRSAKARLDTWAARCVHG